MNYLTMLSLILTTTQQSTDDTLSIVIVVAALVAVLALIFIKSGSKKSAPPSGKYSKTPTAAVPKEDLVAMGRITGTGVRKAEPAKSGTTSVTKPPENKSGEPEKEVPVDPRSADERYAAARDLWICKYCESLNPYPPGMAPVKAPIPAAGPARKSALRGDLLGKGKKPEPTPVKTPGRMNCVACGKQHS